MANTRIPFVATPMTHADVPEVTALEKRAFSLPWSRHAFEHEVQHNPMAHFLVLRRRNFATGRDSASHLVGYGGFWLFNDEAHICTLAVEPEWRGQGLGELLLTHLIDQAAQLDAAVVTLEVRATNRVAQELYAKYGFAQVGLRKGYYSDTGEDAIAMTTERISSAAYQRRFQQLKANLERKLAVRERQRGSLLPSEPPDNA